MTEGWVSELFRLSLWLLGGLIVGAIFGHALWGLLLCGFIYLGRLLYHLKKIVRWLTKGAMAAPPNVSGIAEHIGDLVYQRQRRSLKRRRRLADMVSSFRDSMVNIPDGLVLMDEQRKVSWFNNAAREYLGLKYPTDIDQRIDNLVRQPVFTDYMRVWNQHITALKRKDV